MRAEDLQVVLLYVEDMERSVHFYEELLGLEKVFQRLGRAAYKVGQTLIMLHPGAGEFNPKRPRSVGWGVSIYLQVDDVDGAVDALRQEGVEIFEGPTDEPWGERDAGVLDPDGYHIFLSQSSPMSWLKHLPHIEPD